MPQVSPIDKFFDAVDEAYEVALDTLKAGTDRGYRVSRTLIDQAQKGQHEALQLAQTIVKSPTNLAQTAGVVVQNVTRTQGRVLEVSRQWLDEALDSQQEGREAVRRLIDANRQAGEAVVEASRGAFGRARSRATQIVRPGRDGTSTNGEVRARRKTAAKGD